MAPDEVGSDFCLARLRGTAVVVGELERVVSESLRATDAVTRRGNELVAAIPGDELGAEIALERALSRGRVTNLVLTVVPAGHPEFERLAAGLDLRDGPSVRLSVPSSTDPSRPATLVVIDDEPDVRSMLANLASLHGWEVVAADSRSDAVELCASSGADVLVTDYHLRGGHTGVEVGMACRRAGLGIPIVVFTASAWGSASEDAAGVGASVVSKGDITGLLANLDRLADRLCRSHRRRSGGSA